MTILHADAVGYSQLAAADELAALHALVQAMRRLAASVEAFGGRVVDTQGDNLMAEFEREQAALYCALHVQRKPRERLLQADDAPALGFRIGIHSGPLLVRAGLLYGHTINVAARVQQAAPSGGVLVSDSACERAPSALARCLGGRTLLRCHNLPDPVGARALCGDRW